MWQLQDQRAGDIADFHTLQERRPRKESGGDVVSPVAACGAGSRSKVPGEGCECGKWKLGDGAECVGRNGECIQGYGVQLRRFPAVGVIAERLPAIFEGGEVVGDLAGVAGAEVDGDVQVGVDVVGEILVSNLLTADMSMSVRK